MAEAPAKVENKVLPEGAQKPPGDIRRRVAKPSRKGPFVKYVGPAAHRQISPPAWKSLGIPLKDKEATHDWKVANDKLVEADKFTDEQLDYLLIDDKSTTGVHNFLAVDYDNDGKLVQVEV